MLKKLDRAMKTMSFTKEDFRQFKIAYKEASEAKNHLFVFRGEEFLTDYAKYLIQHLETQL